MEVCIGGSKGSAGFQPNAQVFQVTQKRRETEKSNPGFKPSENLKVSSVKIKIQWQVCLSQKYVYDYK